jgi:GcrA cell cycle regulator
MHGKQWSEEKRSDVERMWHEGHTVAAIAERTGISLRSVGWIRWTLNLPKRIQKGAWDGGPSDLLRTLWAAGCSASVCAKKINEKFGTTFTKNAVIGKRDRLRVPRRVNASSILHEVGRMRGTRSRPPRAVEKRAVPPPKIEIIDTQIPFEQRRQLLTLGRNECHWPVGDVGDEGFFFCGGKADDGCSYCPTHYARSVARHVRTGQGFNFVRSRYA